MLDIAAERGADRARVGAVPVRGDLVGRHARDRLGRTKEGLGRRHVAVLAEHGVDQVAVAVDRSIQVGPAATNLQVGLVNVPAAAAGSTLATAAPAQFVGEQRRELGLPLAAVDPLCGSTVAEHDTTDEEHLGQVVQGEAVA